MKTSQRLGELDLLRFIAAVGVMVYHLFTLPSADSYAEAIIRTISRFGWVGVPLFFMISGFVILQTALARDALGFVEARVARLYPSFIVACLLTATVLAFTGTPASVGTLACNLTMIPGQLGCTYLDGVYWTLLVEVKFYALVFLLIIAGQLARAEWWLLGWSVLTIMAQMSDVHALEILTFKGYAAFFAAGAWMFLVRTRGWTWLRSAGLVISLTLGIAVALRHQEGFSRIDAPWANLTTILIVVALYAALFAATTGRWQLPRSQWWYWLGCLTYPVYLLHNTIGKRMYAALPGDSWVKLAFIFAGVFVVAALIAATIERRFCPAFGKWLTTMRVRLLSRRPARQLAPAQEVEEGSTTARI